MRYIPHHVDFLKEGIVQRLTDIQYDAQAQETMAEYEKAMLGALAAMWRSHSRRCARRMPA
ncbi:hypothetical protein [Variovorax sp. AFSI2.2]|uniref:hypothetical protein n=1 Tax=Variovorax sp. AFSI2.2 TaxID=3384160 RepID=UPI003EB92FF7